MEGLRRRLAAGCYSVQRLKTTSLTEHAQTEDTSGLHSVFDLVTVGLSTAFPVALYVVIGYVTQGLSGPSTVLSILLAALASALTGLCYTELRARVHRVQASAYEYIYRCCGEGAAFTTGWLLVLHHVTCTAAIARSVSANFDFLLGEQISNHTIASVGDLERIGSHLDFVGCCVCVFLAVVVAVGLIPGSHTLRMILGATNFLLLLFILVISIYHIDFNRWSSVDTFFSHGATGVVKGAAPLFYAFMSSETILRTADLNIRAIHRPAMISLTVVHILTLLILILVSSAISLISDPSCWATEAPLAAAYDCAGITWIRYVICLVAIIVLCPVAILQFSEATGVLFDMAKDGILFATFGEISGRTDTPLFGIVVVGALTAVLTLVFNVGTLVQVFAFCVVFIHLLVGVVCVCFHYKPDAEAIKRRRERAKLRKRQRKSKQKLVIRQLGNNNERLPEEERDCYGATRPALVTPASPEHRPPGGEAPGSPSAVVTMATAGGRRVEDRLKSDSGRQSRSDTADDGGATFSRDVTTEPRASQSSSRPHGGRIPQPAPCRGAAAAGNSSSDTDIDEVVEDYQDEVRERARVQQTCRGGVAVYPPSPRTYLRARISLAGFLLSALASALILTRADAYLEQGAAGSVILLTACLLAAVAATVALSRQPTVFVHPYSALISVPHVPWLPLMALWVTTHLLVVVPTLTFLLVLFWMATGVIVYFGYGVRNSREAQYIDQFPEEHRGLLPSSTTAAPAHPASGTSASKVVPRTDRVNPTTAYTSDTEYDSDVLLIP